MEDRVRRVEGDRTARVALGLIAVVVAFGAAPLAAVEQKIAVVDLERALNECDSGEKHGYTHALEASSGALLYNDQTVDVTDEIVKLHNPSPHKEGSKRSSS